MTLQSSSRRDFHFREFSCSEDLVRKKEQLGATTSIVIPARNEETTIGAIVESIRSTCMDRVPLVDELVVIDSESGDRPGGERRRRIGILPFGPAGSARMPR